MVIEGNEVPAPQGGKKSRTPQILWFLLVGLVGAIIGGLVVVAVMPQVILSKMESLQLSVPGSGTSTGQNGSTVLPLVSGSNVDPWQIVVDAAERVSPSVVCIVNTQTAYDFFGR
ncbi:MAG TPA: hypothetical protein PLK53_05740, partial [Bacillota bacterium]|nr:hypothetical protein [Bacillota bacterium]